MIDFNQAVSIIRRNGGFKPNRKDTSYYRTYTIEGNRPLQVRVSNHGTWLWTWYDKDFDPSYAINFCVIFSENGEYDSDVSVDMEIKDEEGNVVGQRKTFEVIQYVYNCQLLDINDATLINQQVQSIWQNKGFKDPFANTIKHAKVMRLKPNEPIEPIVENKDINCNLNMDAKPIRLTESDLHQIVKESVNKILKEADRHREGYWRERWAKQKAEKQAETKDQNTSSEQQKKSTKPQKDRHKKGYYRKYNQAHPERLNRGFTKGYKNGNVSDGLDIRKDDRIWLGPDTYIVGYDELGRPITNHPLSDMLRNKEMEWHDDDWNEGSWYD